MHESSSSMTSSSYNDPSESPSSWKRSQTLKDIKINLHQPADLEKAKEYRLKTSISKWNGNIPRQHRICSTTAEDLGEYGVGLELHFLFLKQLIFAFFIISSISIWPLYTNWKGGYLEDQEANSYTDPFSIANLHGISSNETVLSNAKDLQGEIDRDYFDIWVSDTMYTASFILMILIFSIQGNSRIKRNNKKHDRVSDYAIKIKGIPREGVTEEEIKIHFEPYGEIIEIYLGRRYKGLLRYFHKRSIILTRMATRDSLLTFKNKEKENDKLLKKLTKRLKILDSNIIKKSQDIVSHDFLPIKTVFIIFSTRESKVKCLKAYNGSCFRSYNKNLLFQGKKLKITPAPEPSDIIWENLEIGKFSRFMRIVVSIIAAALLMLFSAGALNYLKTQEQAIPSTSKCYDLNGNYDISLKEAEDTYKDSTEILCWCKMQGWSNLITDSEKASYCSSYMEKWVFQESIKYLASFGVIVINFFLKFVLRKLTYFERLKSLSELQKRIMIKVFFAIFINTAIITLIINITFPLFPSSNEYILRGKYQDFSRDWYLKVGSIFVAMMLISIFSPHVIYLMIFYPLGMIKRKCCWKRYATQYELNLAYQGPDYDIATRTSQVLNLVLTCFLYSGGMPILNIICFIALICIYWTDKFLILRHFSRPPKYTGEIYISAIKILMVGVLLHCFISGCMYGAPDIFPKGFYKDGEYVQADSINFIDRFTIPSGISMILLGISALILSIFILFINKIYEICLRRLHYNFAETKEFSTFNEVLPEIKKYGLVSYNVKYHPVYRLLIDSMAHGNESHFQMKNADLAIKSQDFNIDTTRTYLEENSAGITQYDSPIKKQNSIEDEDENSEGEEEEEIKVDREEGLMRKLSIRSEEREFSRKSSIRSSRGSYVENEKHEKIRIVEDDKGENKSKNHGKNISSIDERLQRRRRRKH
ncbi:unnamed protein product [Blepharisma stoltei]|uniref:RRM domain-containing protein n=1 Tax=Blepharisma stoltei TaxID=1481888 RepID=A0AAU9III8_9CILI|nr:unnamed protein product [Blepharisma stoltei]